MLRDASSASYFQIYRNSKVKIYLSKHNATKEYGKIWGEVLCIYFGWGGGVKAVGWYFYISVS
jgi:hypothetical protein